MTNFGVLADVVSNITRTRTCDCDVLTQFESVKRTVMAMTDVVHAERDPLQTPAAPSTRSRFVKHHLRAIVVGRRERVKQRVVEQCDQLSSAIATQAHDDAKRAALLRICVRPPISLANA